LKKYPLSLSADYCSGWTVANAIREILQNCLDSPAPFEYCFDGDILELTSKNVELPSSTLLLGNSGKRNDPSSVGGFGEGYKIALLILVREGFDVEIRNGSKIWIPSYEYSELFECEVLTITEEYLGGNSDLTFVINGINDEIREEIKHDCLYLQEDLGEVLEGTIGRILKDVKNKLYVGGLFVTDIKGYEYSFDFKPQYLTLNRDRKTVESWDLNYNTSKLIKEVLDPTEIAKLVENNTQDIQNLQHRDKLEEVADVLYDRLTEEYGQDVVVAQYHSDSKDLEDLGYKNVVSLSHTNYHSIIQKSPKYQASFEKITEDLNLPEEDTRSPVELLEHWYEHESESGDCGHWIKFEKMLEVFKSRGVSWDTKWDANDPIPF